MCPNQSLNTWPPKRRRTSTRFPVVSQTTALSTTKGRIIAVVKRSGNGNKRRTRNTDTSCSRPTPKGMEPSGTGPYLPTFQQQDCFTGDSIMTRTYPFPVSGDEFKGKRVLVTGGTKGMGQAMVRRFTLSGAGVATTARSPLPDGQEVALFIRADIGTAAGVKDVIRRIQEEWNGLDILVNNVGGSDAPDGGNDAPSDAAL